MSDNDRTTVHLGRILNLIKQTPQADQILNDERRRSKLYGQLAGSSDLILREIGQQLRDGLMRPRDIFTTEAYRERVIQGVEDQREAFVQSMQTAQRYLEDTIDEAKRRG